MPAHTPSAQRTADHPAWRGWLRRIVAFAVLWWILTGGAADSWWIGAPIVLLAAWLSLVLWASPPLSLSGMARFIPFFAYQSLAGATDVAIRVLQPRMPLHPGVLRQRLQLPPGACRVALANVVSMLPGTLSADLEGDQLVIHALDMRKDLRAMVHDLEPRIAAVFSVELADQGATEASS